MTKRREAGLVGRTPGMTKRETKRKRHADISVLSHSPNDAAARAGVGRSAIYQAMKSGALEYRKLGRRTLILDEPLRTWISSLPLGKPSQTEQSAM